MDILFPCTECLLRGRKHFQKPPTAFGVATAEQVAERILRFGAWTRCLDCMSDSAPSNPSATAPTIPTITCSKCRVEKQPFHFDMSDAKKTKDQAAMICYACTGARFCKSCEKWLHNRHFRRESDDCKTCQLMHCFTCDQPLPQSMFSANDANHFSTINDKFAVLLARDDRNNQK